MTVFGYDGRANLILAVVLVDVGVHYNEEKQQKPKQPNNMGAGGLWDNNTYCAKDKYKLVSKVSTSTALFCNKPCAPIV